MDFHSPSATPGQRFRESNMQKAAAFFWRITFTVLFRLAAIVCTITKKRVCGSLLAVWSRDKILLVKKILPQTVVPSRGDA